MDVVVYTVDEVTINVRYETIYLVCQVCYGTEHVANLTVDLVDHIVKLSHAYSHRYNLSLVIVLDCTRFKCNTIYIDIYTFQIINVVLDIITMFIFCPNNGTCGCNLNLVAIYSHCRSIRNFKLNFLCHIINMTEVRPL